MLRWGWEFLRRRDDYRDLWLANEHRAESTEGGVLTAVTDDYEATRRTYGMSFVVDPRAKLSESQIFQSLAFKPFGYRVSQFFAVTPIGDGPSNISIRPTIGPDEDAFVFDRRLPVAPQLEAVRVFLERLQSERGGAPASPKNHVEQWSSYLRVLDARECGVTFKTIAATLLRGKHAQGAWDFHKAAQAVQRRAPFFSEI